MFSVTISFYDPVRTVVYRETDTPYSILDIYTDEFTRTISEFVPKSSFRVVWYPVDTDKDRDSHFLADMILRYTKTNKIISCYRCGYIFI